jgi:formyl-CoA transferase
VRNPKEVINALQLRANDIIVPLKGAGGQMTSTVSSPIQVHGVSKVSARRAPEIGEHNEQILKELGFDPKAIEDFRASGAILDTRRSEVVSN